MRHEARRVRALFTAGIVILAGFSVSTFSPQFVPVQSGQVPASATGTIDQAKGTGILIGQVIDASTKRGLAGATVSITSTAPASVQTMLPTGEIIISGGASQPSGANDAPRQVLTDSGGRFMFRNLAAGRYAIRASASPYLAGAYGASRAGAAAQTVELTRDDEKRDGLVIQMWKGASISGTIVDEAGEPAIGVTVRSMRRVVSGGRLRLQTTSSATTDDRGVYRMAGLTPGEYLVGITNSNATVPAATADAFAQVMNSGASFTTSDLYRELMSSSSVSLSLLLGQGGGYRVGDFLFQPGGTNLGVRQIAGPAPVEEGRILTYASTFYPGVALITQAGVFTLASGEDRARIDLQLKLVPAVRVSGTVMGPEGPVRNLGLRLLPTGADEFTTDTALEAATSVTDANGAFTFLGVTPGAYTLKVLRIPRPTPVAAARGASSAMEVTGPNGMVIGMTMGSAPATAPPPPPLPPDLTLWASANVPVADRDIAGVVVTLRPGARLAGRIVFEGSADKPTPEQVQQTPINLTPVTTSPSVSLVARRIESDGTFATNGYPPGKYLVSASVPPNFGKWKFKSATQGGRVISDDGLDLQSADVSGLVITFTDQLGEINGTVRSERGDPDQTGSVVVLPADSTAWKEGVINTRRIRSVRLSTTGAFTFGDLPPGAYFVAAVAGDLPENWQLVATLDAITRMATRVEIAGGTKVSQSLTSRPIR